MANGKSTQQPKSESTLSQVGRYARDVMNPVTAARFYIDQTKAAAKRFNRGLVGRSG